MSNFNFFNEKYPALARLCEFAEKIYRIKDKSGVHFLDCRKSTIYIK